MGKEGREGDKRVGRRERREDTSEREKKEGRREKGRMRK